MRTRFLVVWWRIEHMDMCVARMRKSQPNIPHRANDEVDDEPARTNEQHDTAVICYYSCFSHACDYIFIIIRIMRACVRCAVVRHCVVVLCRVVCRIHKSLFTTRNCARSGSANILITMIMTVRLANVPERLARELNWFGWQRVIRKSINRQLVWPHSSDGV